MAVDERARQRLYRKLEEVLGEVEATTLMERLPPEGYEQLATKKDLALLEARLLARMERGFRNQTIALTTIFALLNGLMFAALKFA